MTTTSSKNTRNQTTNGVLNPRSTGFNMAIIYGLLFVPLMLVMDKEITVDLLAIPALLLYVLVQLIESFITKGKKATVPQWLIVGSFVVSVLTAVIMAIVSS
ncbi:hypothetical protein [Pontibacillus sp. HN14]|nr:hypothetical protein [Pontibacillus sp. HN14]MCD5322195.1 hypothetical protein [Pontibacillus sp. HN14]